LAQTTDEEATEKTKIIVVVNSASIISKKNEVIPLNNASTRFTDGGQFGLGGEPQ
jgi:gamma-glutamyl phosphate reductase